MSELLRCRRPPPTSFPTCAFDPDTNRILIQYRDNTTNAGQSLFATISGTSYTTGSKTTIDSLQYVLPFSSINKTVYDTANDRFISVYRDTDADLKSAVISAISSNNSTWIGAAAENISDASSGQITILGGINEGQTGLTVNTTYYVNGDGTLGTSGSYKIGRAISTTKLFITEGNA